MNEGYKLFVGQITNVTLPSYNMYIVHVYSVTISYL